MHVCVFSPTNTVLPRMECCDKTAASKRSEAPAGILVQEGPGEPTSNYRGEKAQSEEGA